MIPWFPFPVRVSVQDCIRRRNMMDHAEILAFRRLVYKFSLKLTKEQSRALVYIRLYGCKERYRDADTLEVLSKLETDGVFSPNNPEGLIEVAKDIGRLDLQNMVKDFVKKRQRKAKASGKVEGGTMTSLESPVSDEELQLKAILEVTLSQAAVFVKQVDILQQAITAGTREQRQRAAEAIRDARCTSQALAERLQKAQVELERINSTSNLQRNSSDYYNLKFGQPEPAQLVKATGRGTETPTSIPRQIQKPSHESQSKPVQIPTQETCHPTQALATSLERTDLEHSRQQDTPFIHQQRLVSPKTSKWISTGDGGKWTRSTEDSGSKSTQSLPLQTKHSDHVLPKPSTMTVPVLKTVSIVGEWPGDISSDYSILNPIGNEPTTDAESALLQESAEN